MHQLFILMTHNTSLLVSDSGHLGQDGRMAEETVEADKDNLPVHVLQLPPKVQAPWKPNNNLTIHFQR